MKSWPLAGLLYGASVLAMSFVSDPFVPGHLSALAWIAVALAIAHPWMTRQLMAAGWTNWWHVALVAVFCRLLVFPMSPADDFWRYWWEGSMQWAGFNPYQWAPADPELSALRTDWWEMINHRDWAAIYPPLTQLAFRILTLAGPWTILAFKVSYLLCDLVVVRLLWKWWPERGGGAWPALAYALHPLPLFAFCGSMHFDIWMVVAMLLGLRWMLEGGRAALAAGAIGVAAGIKMIPLLLGFVWWRGFGRRWLWLGLVPVIMIVPAFALGFPGVNPWGNLGTFAEHARFNDLFWWLLDPMLQWELGGTNELYLKTTVVACGLIGLGIRRDWQRGAYLSLGAVLLCAPVLYPWYVAWILPYALLQRSPFWLALCGSVMLAMPLLDPARDGWWPFWLDRWLIIGIPAVVWLVACWRKVDRK